MRRSQQNRKDEPLPHDKTLIITLFCSLVNQPWLNTWLQIRASEDDEANAKKLVVS